jgi:8-oxo-dGTP pyrophosphatase MutT (NUDIX family)
MGHQLFEVGQKAFIERDGKLLLVFFHNGWLDFPGGRIDEGELDLVESLKREVREETSLEIDVGAPHATWIGRGGSVYLVGYRCRYVSGNVVLSEEHASFQWVDAGSYSRFDDGSAPYRALSSYFENL